ncbi:glycoside hydrolase family 6 protein [Pseudonocardia bannensis]|uniref:Glucanase n=1 Tax=Pseudonocardia bannensis TaxID=630973 RepID=A0A848DF19_9PSEU|nr:glycoside hydrolase family 6 protein [Pseudonocardia bannensis]NMH91164.1 glycoside hydrolase family 6 protein [Pseudonocardia bannensis]
MTHGRTTARRRSSSWAALLAGVAAVLMVAACAGAAPAPERRPAPASVVTSASGFYVDPLTPAAVQVQQWEAAGRSADAAEIRKIAEQPLPLWVTGDAAEAQAQTRDYVDRAEATGQRPLLVAYNIPHRDCGSFSGGGAPDAAYYRDWVSAMAAGLGGRPSTVILEPDAVPHELSGCVDGAVRDERYELLSEAVDTLRQAGASVYLDAGNPGFISDVDALSGALERSGVRRADGFSLNVANFFTVDENAAFGTAISERLGGASFVIDTSRNGLGPVTGPEIDGAPSFCNPPGRALGQAPTTETGRPLVDAYLWIKRPGESDGACRPGEPAAGQWYPEYALGLARRSVG